ncbi:MAG TPA: hypothetical protein VEK12_05255 [Alphaproteobacteria bacterium]|nr:hypothetical protein [Alphaproteobacteria bacterium]
MRHMIIRAMIIASGGALAFPALAADLVALVEEVSGAAEPVEPFTYMTNGKTVDLGLQGTLVIDYLRSCTRETITGGTVTIGIDHSSVTGGKLRSKKIECDGERLALLANQANQSGGLVFRKMQAKSDSASPPPGEQTIYGTMPLVDFGEPLPHGENGKLRLMVERLDASSKPATIEITADHLLYGRLYDFAASHRALAQGGVYRLTAGERSITVRVDPTATSGAGPVLGRLVRL